MRLTIFRQMAKRLVTPELLDSLPPNDPEAVRSRRDLHRVNRLMGNERWILRAVDDFSKEAAPRMVEIGAGEGVLCNRLARKFPEATITAYDLAPRPATLDPRVDWRQGDLFKQPAPCGDVLIANLFLHHFEDDALAELGRWMANFRMGIFNEPDRAHLPHFLGTLAHPFINRVTRHDMHVSIRAGFAAGEIPRSLGLDATHWKSEETSTWRGARRVIAWRT